MSKAANLYTHFKGDLAGFHNENIFPKYWKIKKLKSREEAEMARPL
jgi:hypothetical protein